MFCNNCGTQYDVIPVETGKSKFCRSCGIVLYKNENGKIVFNAEPENIDLLKQKEAETERLRQEQLLKQRQQEIQQEKDAEAEKQRQEQILKQRQLEIQRENELEAERQRLAIIEQQRQLELQKQQEIEQEQARQIKLQQQLQQERIEKELREKERLEKEQKEKEIKEREIHRQKEYDLIQLQEEKKKEAAIHNEKEAELISLRGKKAELQKLLEENSKPKSSFFKYFLVALIASALGAGGYYLADRYLLNNSNKIDVKDNPNITEQSILITPEKIKNDLIGKELTGWGKLEEKHISAVLSNIQTRKDSTICFASLSLEGYGVKSKAEVTIDYTDTTATNIATDKITFQNTAPVNEWYSFAPVPNCSIFVNTNNNPILIKACENCEAIKMNTNNETQQRLASHPATIFITSETKSEATVDFTYIPE